MSFCSLMMFFPQTPVWTVSSRPGRKIVQTELSKSKKTELSKSIVPKGRIVKMWGETIRLAKAKVEFGRKRRIIEIGCLWREKENYQKRLFVKRKGELSKAFFCEEKRRIIRSSCDKIENCETAADLPSPVKVGQEGRDLRNFQEKMWRVEERRCEEVKNWRKYKKTLEVRK